jgi:hypothetical protein
VDELDNNTCWECGDYCEYINSDNDTCCQCKGSEPEASCTACYRRDIEDIIYMAKIMRKEAAIGEELYGKKTSKCTNS